VRTILGKYFEYAYGVSFTVKFSRKISEKLPGIIFTHDHRYIKHLRNVKAIFLVRDPRDVVVSRYHYFTWRALSFSGNVSEFIRSRRGIRSVIKDQNAMVVGRDYPLEVLWLFYEDLREDPMREMLKIFEFLEMDVDEGILKRAVEFTDFKNLQKLERGKKFKAWGREFPGKKGVSSLHVRRGKVGGYKDELSGDDIAYVEDQINRNLRLGRYR